MKAVKGTFPLVSTLWRPRILCIATRPSRLSFSHIRTASNGNPQSGNFTRIPLDMLVEEETIQNYKAEHFYPVELGHVFKSRYKVVAKLGFGTASTVWLCRDLKTNTFVSLKVCVRQDHNDEDIEVLVSQRIRSIEADHPGQAIARAAIDDFQIESAHGKHQCLVFNPMGMTFTVFRNKLPGKVFNKILLQQSIHGIIIGLDFLHQIEVIHTDLSPNNILLGITDVSVFSAMEQDEIDHPSSRKALPDRTLYVSHRMGVTNGMLAICDFGAARIGKSQTGDVMPTVYRAPEIIMGMQWDCKIDMWALGCMTWDLLQGRRLFRAVKNDMFDDELHLAEMVSLMGPPPREFPATKRELSSILGPRRWVVCPLIVRMTNTDRLAGNWIASTAIPDQSLESLEKQLESTDKELLLKLMRKLLRWLPEDRPSAEDLFTDEFITQWEVEMKLGASSSKATSPCVEPTHDSAIDDQPAPRMQP